MDTITKQKKHFLDLPLDDLAKPIFQYVSWNDLLRFRKVCRKTNVIVKQYLKLNPERAPEIQINEDKEKSLPAFVAMEIPTTNIFINNISGHRFYEKNSRALLKFLTGYGPKIKSIRLERYTLCPLGKELMFLEALQNVTHFEANTLIYGKFVDEQMKIARAEVNFAQLNRILVNPLPQNFTKIESIKIGNNELKAVDVLQRTGEVFWNCSNLKFACLPHCPTFLTKEDFTGVYRPFGTLMRDLFALHTYIVNDPDGFFRDDPNHKPTLECFDFQNYLLDFTFQEWSPEKAYSILVQYFAASAKTFIDICIDSPKFGVKLMNVNSLWFCGRWYSLRNSPVPDTIGVPIISVVNLDPCMMDLDMPNLEKIWIPLTSHCVALGNDRPEWPKLKILDITVDDKNGHCWDVYGIGRLEDAAIKGIRSQRTFYLFKALFHDVVRVNMTELNLQFVEGNDQDDYAIPKTNEIVDSCPNLKKIRLRNWQGQNSALVKLWKGLPGLEEISLEYCRNLGNVAFVGEDVQNPVFFRLKNLKKLSLKGLNEMPKITDLLFSLVLQHMKLEVLILTSDEPIKQITKTGVTALLQGRFAETIQRFPFKNWCLSTVTAAEFKNLEKQFRSYYML